MVLGAVMTKDWEKEMSRVTLGTKFRLLERQEAKGGNVSSVWTRLSWFSSL